MKIASYELYEVSIPTRRKHTWASSTVDVGQGWAILKIMTNDGITGYGEATAMPEWGGDFGRYFGESAGTIRTVLAENLFPAIEGMDPFDIDLIHEKMDNGRLPRRRRRGGAVAVRQVLQGKRGQVRG